MLSESLFTRASLLPTPAMTLQAGHVVCAALPLQVRHGACGAGPRRRDRDAGGRRRRTGASPWVRALQQAPCTLQRAPDLSETLVQPWGCTLQANRFPPTDPFTATDPNPNYDSRDPVTGQPSLEIEITMSRRRGGAALVGQCPGAPPEQPKPTHVRRHAWCPARVSASPPAPQAVARGLRDPHA